MKTILLVAIFSFYQQFAFAAPEKLSGAKIYKNQCSSCHGNSGLRMNTPVLHGQEPTYIKLALTAFSEDRRQDHLMSVMNGIAKNLTKSQMDKVSKYLASQEPCEIDTTVDPQKEGFREAFMAGRELVAEKNCLHCHGSFHHFAPRLVGQKFSFLKQTLVAFKDKTRVDPMMNRILENATPEEIQNISTYLSALRLMRTCQGEESRAKLLAFD